MKIITTYSRNLLFLIALVFVAASSSAQTDLQNEPKTDQKDTLINISSDIQYVPYGKMTKRNVSSSISSISGKDIEKNTVFSLGNTLFSKIPGLIVDQNGGEPGSDTPGFNVRGTGTFG